MVADQEKVECWVRACKYNDKGVCTTPDKPATTGCALTWVLGGGMPQEEKHGKTE